MQVISTNTGQPQTIEWRGKNIKTGIYKFSVNQPVFLGTEDVKNDHVIDRRYHGGIDKACYLYSADHYNFWKKLYPETEMPPGMFGENLTVKGLHENDINIGDTFQVGGVIVQATQPRQPCFKLGIRFGTQKIVKQFIESGFSGVYVRVLQKGNVNANDEFILIEKKDSLSIQKVFELLYTNNFEKEKSNAEKAINDSLIAESCKKDLIKHWSKYL